MSKTPAPTTLSFNALQTAFDHFNKELFGGKLPQCIILLHRKKNARGYFWAERFSTEDDATTVSEIALNPTIMRGRTVRDTLSTLVHEMVHLEQHAFGKPPKGAYHDKQWGAMMDAVGLTPDNGQGGRTGMKVSHKIVEGGPFDVSCAKLLAKGLKLPYSERTFTKSEEGRAKAKRASKTKFICPGCDAAAWGKPTLHIVCGECEEEMVAA